MGRKAGWWSERKNGSLVSQAFWGREGNGRARREEPAVGEAEVGRDPLPALGESHGKVHRS